MKYLIFLLILGSVTTHASSQECCISPVEKTRLVQLTFNDFDQDLTHSWRLWADHGCYDVAIDLIETYMKINNATLKDSQKGILTWHAGQLYGFKSDTKNARIHFVASLNPQEQIDSPVLWNDYVIGSLAFLDHDLEIIKAHRNKIANGPTFNGKKPNLHVMDDFISYFDKPYGVAYSDGKKPVEPKVCKPDDTAAH